MIFKLKYSSEFKSYFLEPYADKFTLPDKIYGKLKSKAIRVWNTYVREKKSTGVLLVGDKGSGKSLTGNILSNIAIENNLPVIMVSEIKVEEELVSYLSGLKNCVLYLDEFAKLFGSISQNNLLTMLSDPINTRKIVILTENSLYYINSHIIDRPGRIRYRYDFNKLERDELVDYLNDNGVDGRFAEDLINTYESAKTFSFDILAAIVNEHKQYPHDSLKEIVNTLNVKVIAKPLEWKVVEVRKKVKDEYEDQLFNTFGRRLPSTMFKERECFNINVYVFKDSEDMMDRNKASEVINFSNNGEPNFKTRTIEKDLVILERKGYVIRLVLAEREDDEYDNDDNNAQPNPMPSFYSNPFQ